MDVSQFVSAFYVGLLKQRSFEMGAGCMPISPP